LVLQGYVPLCGGFFRAFGMLSKPSTVGWAECNEAQRLPRITGWRHALTALRPTLVVGG